MVALPGPLTSLWVRGFVSVCGAWDGLHTQMLVIALLVLVGFYRVLPRMVGMVYRVRVKNRVLACVHACVRMPAGTTCRGACFNVCVCLHVCLGCSNWRCHHTSYASKLL